MCDYRPLLELKKTFCCHHVESVCACVLWQELDPVTLHNQALLNMDTKPSEGFEKLAFLLQQPSFPPVTFGNLLLLYCKHEVHSGLQAGLRLEAFTLDF